MRTCRGVGPVLSMLAIALLSGCDGVQPRPIESPSMTPPHMILVDLAVDVRVHVRRERDQIVVDALLSNPLSRTVTLSTGPCSFILRAHTRPELMEPAYWDDQSAEPTACPDLLLIHDVPPGQSQIELGRRSGSRLAMGMPAPGGFYGVVVVKNGGRLLLNGGRVD